MSVLSPDRQAIKNATAKTIAAVGGGEKGAGHTRVAQQRLSAYGNKFQPDFMPVDVVSDLESVIEGVPGAPFITRELARQRGYLLVRCPATRPEGKPWALHIADLSRETGEAVAKLAVSLADDGDVCRKNIVTHDLVREAWEVAQAAVELATELENKMAADTT